MPLRTSSAPILRERKGGVVLADLLQQLQRRDPLTAEALSKIANEVNFIGNALRQPPPPIEDILVTDSTGALITRIGSWVDGDRVRSGFWTRESYLGGSDPGSAIIFTDENGQLIIGRNGSASVLDPYGDSAAWIGTQWDTLAVTGAVDNGSGLIRLAVTGHPFITGDSVIVGDVGGVPNAMGPWTVAVIDPNTIDLQGSGFGGAYTGGGWVSRVLHISGAVNNGSGLIRLIVPGHNYEDGDRVAVRNVGGVPNAMGEWTVAVVDANTIDLEGSAFAGAYTGGGTALRFFAGGLFANVAIGPSFSDYRLRAFPDGSLRIRDAELTLSIGGETVSISDDNPQDVAAVMVSSDTATTRQRSYRFEAWNAGYENARYAYLQTAALALRWDNASVVLSAAGVPSLEFDGLRVLTTRQPDPGIAATAVAGSAGATYTATERALINSLVAQVNNLIADRDRLRTLVKTHGLMA
jgi:hypothetical protein